MTLPSQPAPLTEEQQQQCCWILSLGCDRQTVCKYLGCTPAQLREAMRRDAKFAAQLSRAEATAELSHMRNLQNAAKDEKHWRASVWWLERRAPERYARRAADAISTAQLQAFVEELADVLVAEITSPSDRQRLLTRLSQIACEIQDVPSDEPMRAQEAPPDEADRESTDL